MNDEYRDFLHLYEHELEYIQGWWAEFVRQYPDVSDRFGGLDPNRGCPDPFVQCLLEGFAFLAARVQHEIEAQLPRFTQSLLETVYPHYLAPTPSMCIVQFEPDYRQPALAQGSPIPRGSYVQSRLAKEEQRSSGSNGTTKCKYRTASDVVLWPVAIAEARYYVHGLDSLHLPENLPQSARAALRIRLTAEGRCDFSALQELDSLTLYILGSGAVPGLLYEQLLAQALGVLVQRTDHPKEGQVVLERSSLRPVGFDEEETLLPYDLRSAQGFRLLHEYFAFPQRYLFVRIANLRSALSRFPEKTLDIVIPFKKSKADLEERVSAKNLRLFCSPAVNLFAEDMAPVRLDASDFEYEVVRDINKPLDYEVYRILRVEGREAAARGQAGQVFEPFYLARNTAGGKGHYMVHRRPRPPALKYGQEKEQKEGTRLDSSPGTYRGSDVYLQLVDATAAPFRTSLKWLDIKAWCTNRGLPSSVRFGQEDTQLGQRDTDFTMDQAAPCKSIWCVGTPTAPRPSYAEEGRRILWRAIDHLSLNYLSLLASDRSRGTEALRDLLRLYGAPGDKDSGVVSVSSKSVVRRVPSAAPLACAHGLRVTVKLEEAKFRDFGPFLFGAVLEQFFTRYVSINTFIETVLRTVDSPGAKKSRKIAEWRMRAGQRPIL